MKKFCNIALLWAVASIVTLATLPCPADEKKEDGKDILTEDDQREQRQRGRWELTDDECNRLLEVLKKSDPKKAREIARLRKKDPEKFRAELRTNAREEYDKIIYGRLEKYYERRRQERRAEFIEWLTKNIPDVASELAKLRERNPDLYTRKYDWAEEKYGRVFRESRDHPEETKILLEDLKLRDRENYLVGKIKRTNSEKDRKMLTAQLEEVLSDRYDLIVRRKQLHYEIMLKKLEELKEQVKKSEAQVEQWKDAEHKSNSIKTHLEELISEAEKFSWD